MGILDAPGLPKLVADGRYFPQVTKLATVTTPVAIAVGAHQSYSANSRADTVGTTSGSSTVTDTAITAADYGRPVTAPGIPAGSYVGTVTAGASFLLSSTSKSQTTVTATATATVVAAIGSNGLAPVLPPLTSGAVATALAAGQVVRTKVSKSKTDTSNNAVTITCAGSDTFEGGTTTLPLTTPGEKISLIAGTPVGGTGPVWIVDDHTVPRDSLDLRHAPIATKLRADQSFRYSGGSDTTHARTIVLMGDSITNQNVVSYNSDTLRSNSAAGYWTHANALLRHRIRMIANAGIPGQKATDMVSRFTSDVIARTPGYVLIYAGTNDATAIANGTETQSDYQTAMTSMLDSAKTNNIRAIVCTIGPRNVTNTATTAAIYAINTWLRDQARSRPEIILVDWHAALSAGSSVAYATGMSSTADASGLHPQAQGAAIMGLLLAQALAPVIPMTDILPQTNADPSNKVTNALQFGTSGTLGTGGTGQVSDSWLIQPLTPSTYRCSKVPRSDEVPGFWQQVRVDSGYVKCSFNVTGFGTVYNTGEQWYAMAEFETDDDLVFAPGGYLRLGMFALKPDFTSGANGVDFDTTSAANPTPSAYTPRAGVMLTPPVVIPSTATLRLALQFELNGAGTFRVGRAGLYKVGTGPMADLWVVDPTSKL